MKTRKVKLRRKIMIFTSMIIIITVILISLIFSSWVKDNLEASIGTSNMNTAITISKMPNFSDLLESEDPDGIIQEFVNQQVELIEEQDMIVVANMEGKRYGHPNMERLGQYFVGGDERRVIETGESYISKATGTLGPSLRAFAPVVNPNGQQIGFVMVGTLLEEIKAIQSETVLAIYVVAAIVLSLGILGTFILTDDIKKSLLGLEPDQIRQLYTEKDSMLRAIQEGIISIDENKVITMINDSAKAILELEDKDIIGRRIDHVFPNSGLEDVLASGKSQISENRYINGINIMVNIVPILNNGKIVGVIASFRDKTEVTMLAEEITGFKEIVETLRANSHEFLNKLHVILGLIQIGEIEEAKTYIIGIKESKEQITSSLMENFKDPILIGLFLGKKSRANELDISFDIIIDSNLKKYKGEKNSMELVTVLGNIIENAFEATINNKDEKRVTLTINDLNDHLEFIVEDNGLGIKKEDLDKIFLKGYSSNNSKTRGIGLSLVEEKVQRLEGEISLNSTLNIGTIFKLVIPKED